MKTSFRSLGVQVFLFAYVLVAIGAIALFLFLRFASWNQENVDRMNYGLLEARLYVEKIPNSGELKWDREFYLKNDMTGAWKHFGNSAETFSTSELNSVLGAEVSGAKRQNKWNLIYATIPRASSVILFPQLAATFWDFPKMWLFSLAGILLISIVGVAMAVELFSRRFKTPIASLARSIDFLGAGRYEAPKSPVYLFEFSELFEKFNLLLRRILERDRQLEKSSDLATRDGLTGLHNYQFFCAKVSELLPLARRNKWSMGVVLVDVDYFRSINERFGVLQGDEILKLIAAELGKICRTTDFVCRYGGNEFVLIAAPHTAPEGTLILAEKLRNQIEKTVFPLLSSQQKSLLCTVSIGVAQYLPEFAKRQDFKQPTELVDFALDKLKNAKENGRNRVAS